MIVLSFRLLYLIFIRVCSWLVLCVPKTCATWADALRDAVGSVTRTVPGGQVLVRAGVR